MNNIENCINELGYAVAPIKGVSMLPLLKEGKSRVELEARGSKQLKKGDIVLYKKNEDTLVLHRIIKVCGDDTFILLGDHQFENAERVSLEQIIAVAKGFFIKGNYVDDNTRWYKIYKKIWVGSLFFRRFCLALLSLKKK